MNDSATSRIYRIRNWDQIYENNRSRDLKYLDYVPMKNRMDTDAWCRIVDHSNGAAHIGAWHSVVFVGSSSEPPTPRGTLIDASGEPHTAESIARISRIKLEVFVEAWPRFVEVRWLELAPVIGIVSDMPQDAVKPNGRAATAEVIPDGGFSEFWPRWVALKQSNVNEYQAHLKWTKCVQPGALPRVLECLASYAASDLAFRRILMNPDNWIQAQSKNNWQTRWPPPKIEPQSAKAGVAERTKRLGHARAAEGKPL